MMSVILVSLGQPTEGWMMIGDNGNDDDGGDDDDNDGGDEDDDDDDDDDVDDDCDDDVDDFRLVKWHLCGTDSFVFSLLPQVSFKHCKHCKPSRSEFQTWKTDFLQELVARLAEKPILSEHNDKHISTGVRCCQQFHEPVHLCAQGPLLI